MTVALSGDAGDEVFGGYNRHLWGPRLWRRPSRVPYPLRQAIARALRAPYLDHRVVELAWRQPMSMKIRELIDRPKAGFAIPIGK